MTVVTALQLADAARMMRDAVKDRSYRGTPIGLVVARYYRWKKNEWGALASTLRDYELPLGKLALHFADLELADLEPPIGVERLREFWDHYWGDRTPRTRAKILSILRDFFAWAVREGLMHGNPAAALTRPKKRGVERVTYSGDEVRAILSSQPRLRDRVALAIVFHTGIRKGALLAIQFKHFDHARRRLTVFTKGGKVREVPIVDERIWLDLERHILDRQAEPDEFLLYPEVKAPRKPPGFKAANEGPIEVVRERRFSAMSGTAGHRWWYGCLQRAGLVAEGVTHGKKLHSARHTAGQTLLDRSHGNLKAVQKLLGHASIQTTGDIYTDWDDQQLADVMRDALSEGDD